LRVGVAIAFAFAVVASGCAHREARSVRTASRSLARDVGRNDAAAIHERVLPGARASVDTDTMLRGTAGKAWSRALKKPIDVQARAEVMLTPEHPVQVVWTASGWRFAEDPTDVYAQATPRQALRALVLASRQQRWDVLIRLAPQRYRVGLSADDLRRAWTEGESAQVLRAARDLLAEHLWDPIVADAHEATLDLGGGRVARLEREGARWVVVEF